MITLLPMDVPRLAERLARGSQPGANGCRVWAGRTTPDGYGKITLRKVDLYAHRMAWTTSVGPIPPGMFVLHKCDNPPCISIAHLFLGTPADNMRDRDAKGRGAARLNDVAVRVIRLMYERGMATQQQLAEAHGVGHSTVSRVVLRKSWAHVP